MWWYRFLVVYVALNPQNNLELCLLICICGIFLKYFLTIGKQARYEPLHGTTTAIGARTILLPQEFNKHHPTRQNDAMSCHGVKDKKGGGGRRGSWCTFIGSSMSLCLKEKGGGVRVKAASNPPPSFSTLTTCTFLRACAWCACVCVSFLKVVPCCFQTVVIFN